MSDQSTEPSTEEPLNIRTAMTIVSELMDRVRPHLTPSGRGSEWNALYVLHSQLSAAHSQLHLIDNIRDENLRAAELATRNQEIMNILPPVSFA